MAKIFQIGAAGGIGRRLSEMLVRSGARVTGMHRRAEQAAVIEGTGSSAVRGDLIEDSVQRLAELIAGHDVVVFSAGAHGTGVEQTNLIDGKGLEKAVDAALRAGVRRFILVSVFMDAHRGSQSTDGFENYIRVKREADVYLAATDLEWVIVRPGRLTDGEGSGLVAAGPALQYGTVSRDNVAEFIHEAIYTPALRRRVIELVDGDKPVSAAMRELIESF